MGGGAPQAETSPYETDVAYQAQKKYEFEKNTIRPLTGVLMRRVNQEKQPWREERAIGRGVSQANAAIAPQTQAMTRQMIVSGQAPNSGAFIAREGAIGSGTAVARAGAGIDAGMAQDNKYVQGLQKIVKIGNRQATQAQDAMTTAAKQHNAQLGNAAGQDAAESAQQQQMIGTAVGAGIAIAVIA